MKFRLFVAGLTLAVVLVACHSNPSGIAQTDASQDAQLARINATTVPGSGRRMLFATPKDASTGNQPGVDAPTLGQQMQAAKRPPK